MENKEPLHCEAGRTSHNHHTVEEVKECNSIHLTKEMQKNNITLIEKTIEEKKLELETEEKKLKKEETKLQRQREISKQMDLEKEISLLKKRIKELEDLIQKGVQYFNALKDTDYGPERTALLKKTCKLLAITAY